MAKCDLCGATCKAIELVELMDSYQTDGVVDICPDCSKWANKVKSDLLLEIAPKLRAAIAARKGGGQITIIDAPARWWRRLGRAVAEAFSA